MGTNAAKSSRRPAPGTPRSLADDLRARSDDELATLLRARPDLTVPVPVDVAQLASRAATRASTMRALDRLDRFTLNVVDALAVLPTPATTAAIQAALDAAPADLDAALAKLRAQAITWGSETSHQLVRVAHDLTGPHPAGLGPAAKQALLSGDPKRLATIVTNLSQHVAPLPSGHASNAGSVAELFADSTRLAAVIDTLSDGALAALNALSAGPPTGRVENANRPIEPQPRTPIDELLARGLVVPVDDQTVVLPREIGLYLRGHLVHPSSPASAPEPGSTVRDVAIVDGTAGAGAFAFVRKIETLLDAWGEEPPPVLRSGGLGVRELRRLPTLLDTDEATTALVTEVAYAGGLLAPSDSHDATADEVWLPTLAYDNWLRDDVAQRWASLAQAWFATSRVPGLVGSRDDKDRLIASLGTELSRPLAPEIRRLALAVLARLPAGSAPTPDEVVEIVQWERPRRGGRIRDDVVRWTLREAEALGITGLSALATFARPLVDGRSAEKAATAAAEAVQHVLPEPLDHVLLQADLTAVAPGPLRADIGRELALLSDVESRGGASVHRFTAESLRRGLDHGRSAADILGFLGTVSRTPVPQPLTYLVNDVARKHGLLRVGSASSFVRCDDPAIVAEILAYPQASALGLRRLSPEIVTSSLEPATLLTRLRQLGYAPAAEAGDGSVVIAEARQHRAATRTASPSIHTERQAPDETLLGAAVRAIRAGDRAAARRPTGESAHQVPPATSAQTVADLRSAVERTAAIWIGYIDHHGVVSDRVVDAIRLEGGWLTAYDHRTSEIRSFAVHRISGVAHA